MTKQDELNEKKVYRTEILRNIKEANRRLQAIDDDMAVLLKLYDNDETTDAELLCITDAVYSHGRAATALNEFVGALRRLAPEPVTYSAA